MLTHYKGDGRAAAHNFTNRYIDEAELQKPSSDVAQSIAHYTKDKLDSIVGLKTQTAHGKVAEAIKPGEAQYIRFTPNSQNGNEQTKGQQRIIKVQSV